MKRRQQALRNASYVALQESQPRDMCALYDVDEALHLVEYLVEFGLEALDPDAKGILHLFYREGMSRRQIASQLDIPEGTLAHHLRRARAELRRKLAAVAHELLASEEVPELRARELLQRVVESAEESSQ